MMLPPNCVDFFNLQSRRSPEKYVELNINICMEICITKLCKGMIKMMKKKIAHLIDHTILTSTATYAQIVRLCAEADKYGFASVCVNPCNIALVKDTLRNSKVKVCTVIGFPLGSSTTETKIFEAYDAIRSGANELDYVLNVGDVLNDKYNLVKKEMKCFVELRAKQTEPVIVKVILETCYLNTEQIVRVCMLAKETGLDFVKTSTGFGSGGATLEHIKTMREIVGPDLGVKASGGIRTYEDAMAMINAGANRIGTSAGVAIVSESLADLKTDLQPRKPL